MKNNKKLVLGSVVALALSVGVLAPNSTKADEVAPVEQATQSVGTNDAAGKTDAQKITEAQAKAKKQLDDAGVPFENQKDVLAYPNNVYNIEQKTNEILAAKEKEDKELAKTDLGKAKLAAKAELKKDGYQLGLYDEAINNANDLYEIEQVKENLRNYKDQNLKTIDQYNKDEADKKAAEDAAKKPLADAKANALAELKKAGLGNDKNDYVIAVNNATTVYEVEQAKEAGLEWAKENLTTIDEWNEKEASKTRRLTIDEWLKLQEEKEKPSEDDKKPEEKPSDDKKVTIDEWNLNNAKKEAIEELKAAGITSDFYFNLINKAKTVEGVEALKAEILKSHEDSKEDDGKKVTIDEWNLNNAKKEAIEELKAAGITGQIYFDQINKAKTVEGVEALKAEILKAHAEKPVDPEEPENPEDDKKPEDDEKPSFDDLFDYDKIKDLDKEDDKDLGDLFDFDKIKENAEKDPEKKEIWDEFMKLLKDKKSSKEFLAALEKDQDKFAKLFDFSKVDENGKIKEVKEVKEAKKENKKVNNVETGVAGLTGVVATLAASAVALFKSKRK